jgi:hypothetical protein
VGNDAAHYFFESGFVAVASGAEDFFSLYTTYVSQGSSAQCGSDLSWEIRTNLVAILQRSDYKSRTLLMLLAMETFSYEVFDWINWSAPALRWNGDSRTL